MNIDKEYAKLYERHGRVYIDERTFNKCFVKFTIDIGKLGNHMLSHGLFTREQLGDVISLPHDQVHNLLLHISKAGGQHGYFLLYISLCESAEKDNHQGHKDAVKELQKTGYNNTSIKNQ